MVAPADIHDSQLYGLTLDTFETSEVQDHPTIISTDTPYCALKIHRYNRKRGVKSNITATANWRTRR